MDTKSIPSWYTKWTESFHGYYRETIFHTTSRDFHSSFDESGSGSSKKFREIDSRTVKQSQTVLCVLCVILSGDFLYWSNGLAYGFWIFFIAFIFVALSYFCFTICLAEINSCIPFAGGSYGFVRIAISPMLGYIVAFNDRLHAGLLFARSLAMVGRIISIMAGYGTEHFQEGSYQDGEQWEPFYWLCGMILILLYFFHYKENVWRITSLQAIITFSLLIFFFIIACKSADFATHAYGHTFWSDSNNPFVDDHTDESGLKAFMKCIPMAMLLFNGLEVLPCSATCVKNPRISLPRASLILYAVSVIVGCVLIFLVASNEPSTGFHSIMALNEIWQNQLHLSPSHTVIFSLIPFLGSVFASSYALERLSYSLNKSKYTVFSHWEHAIANQLHGLHHIHFLIRHLGPMILEMFSIFVIMLICFYFKPKQFIWSLCELALLSSIFLQCSIYLTYLKLHKQYSTLKRKYTFTYGNIAAYAGMIFCTLFFIAMIGFSTVNDLLGYFLIVICLAGIAKYVLHIVKYQTFSDEEETILFVVHVVKANMERHKRMHHQYRASVDWSVVSAGSKRKSGRRYSITTENQKQVKGFQRSKIYIDNSQSQTIQEPDDSTGLVHGNVIGTTHTIGEGEEETESFMQQQQTGDPFTAAMVDPSSVQKHVRHESTFGDFLEQSSTSNREEPIDPSHFHTSSVNAAERELLSNDPSLTQEHSEPPFSISHIRTSDTYDTSGMVGPFSAPSYSDRIRTIKDYLTFSAKKPGPLNSELSFLEMLEENAPNDSKSSHTTPKHHHDPSHDHASQQEVEIQPVSMKEDHPKKQRRRSSVSSIRNSISGAIRRIAGTESVQGSFIMTSFLQSPDMPVNLEVLAAKLSERNEVLHNHLIMTGSCDELDMNAFLEAAYLSSEENSVISAGVHSQRHHHTPKASSASVVSAKSNREDVGHHMYHQCSIMKEASLDRIEDPDEEARLK